MVYYRCIKVMPQPSPCHRYYRPLCRVVYHRPRAKVAASPGPLLCPGTAAYADSREYAHDPANRTNVLFIHRALWISAGWAPTQNSPGRSSGGRQALKLMRHINHVGRLPRLTPPKALPLPGGEGSAARATADRSSRLRQPVRGLPQGPRIPPPPHHQPVPPVSDVIPLPTRSGLHLCISLADRWEGWNTPSGVVHAFHRSVDGGKGGIPPLG